MQNTFHCYCYHDGIAWLSGLEYHVFSSIAACLACVCGLGCSEGFLPSLCRAFIDTRTRGMADINGQDEMALQARGMTREEGVFYNVYCIEELVGSGFWGRGV